MRALINLEKGWRLARSAPGLIAGLFLLNLCIALTLAPPMYRALHGSMDASLAGERMTKGFDYLFWEEFRDSREGLARTFSPAVLGKGALLTNLEILVKRGVTSLPGEILLAGILFLLMRTFFLGGVITVYHDGGKKNKSAFFQGAARVFPAYAGIAVLSTGLYLFGIGVLNRGLGSITHRIASTSASEIPPFIFSTAVSLLMLGLILGMQMVFDYARILTVTARIPRPDRAVREALRFISRHIASAGAIVILIFLVQVILSLLFLFLDGIWPQTSALGVAGGMLLQQIFIFSLVGIRCWLYASQLELVKFSG